MGSLETSFTRLVGCNVPIQLAGMGSILSPELAAAVSDAGGLGQITFAGIEVDDAKQRLDKLTSLTSKPFGVNILIPYLDRNIGCCTGSGASCTDPASARRLAPDRKGRVQ